MFTLIANSGIQLLTFRLTLNTQDKFKMWFHEWYDTAQGQWTLDLASELTFEDHGNIIYKKVDLFNGGYLNDTTLDYTPDDLLSEGISPLSIDGELCSGVKGELYKMTFADRNNLFRSFENKWLPIPYFFKRTETRFKFSPMNWARVKFVPFSEEGTQITYDVILAFDTRAKYENDEYNECPVFPDQFCSEMNFALCDNEFFLMDYCSPKDKWRYIDEYIFDIIHPTYRSVAQIKGNNVHKMGYIASYIFLMNFLAQNKMMPLVRLYKDKDVPARNVDMVIDIGNSKTTALLIENNSSFNNVKPLSLLDYTDILKVGNDKSVIQAYKEPFDMRLAFRRVELGAFGIKNSKQFVYPSFLRLGQEASKLIHSACSLSDSSSEEIPSTYSSPKRYLWDNKPRKVEWEFLVLPGEKTDHILNLPGLTQYITSDGRLDVTGKDGGRSAHYSRRSLMTFSFLEMLAQALTQVNSDPYRVDAGHISNPRKIKRIIVTCPTAMSKVEREALVKCAKDAVTLYAMFSNDSDITDIEIIPSAVSMRDTEGAWYYDEATCAQLVYMYSEVGHKYKGDCTEFFSLYGKQDKATGAHTLTVGSLDIGAGTSDMMISEYTYQKNDLTTITPDPKFYDSFYFAGDDMLKSLIRNIMLLDEKHSSLRKAMKSCSSEQYRQKIKDYFGPDHNGQSVAKRIFRRDFNIQYSVPLMTHFLSLASKGVSECTVTFDDVFKVTRPNDAVIEDFKQRMGVDITKLEWKFNNELLSSVIAKEFQPLLQKIAAMFYAHSCDVILLSGRPASLPVMRNLFLKYYPVTPNRLITLNNYYVGDWYPFDDNTGYVTNPKTIVAMGGVIGHYASSFSNLEKFSINLEKLSTNLKSTINYIESSRDGQLIEYVITPEKSQGMLTLSKLPLMLNVNQLGLPSYPSRALYSVDFNYQRLENKFRFKAQEKGEFPTDARIQSMLANEIEALKARLPYKVTIERDLENKEKLSIASIEDRNGVDLADSCIEINLQSLGAEEQYWLDSGAFEF